LSTNVTHPIRQPGAAGAAPARGRVRPALVIGMLALALALIAALAVAIQGQQGLMVTSSGAPATPTPIARYVARGQVQPVVHARVGTIAGGVIQELRVEVGDLVTEQQQIARVVSPTSTELIVAPLSGTVMSTAVHRGDTVLPGTTLLTVGDASRLQVETTDLDEFVIASVYRGQDVWVLVEALDRELPGRVRTAAIEPSRSPEGDDHYPVTIELLELPAELRPGMNVRIRLDNASNRQ
jgi:multidrug efflux pump subunit AcrA (membrane-fusion protein)